MTEIFTAKTVEEAKQMAAEKFGKKLGEIKFEVIEQGKKGFLGIGQVDARVKASVADASVQPKAAAPKKETVVKEAPKAQEAKPAEPEKKAEEPAVSAPEPEKVAEVVEAPAEEAKKESDEEEFSLEDFTLIEDESQLHPKVKIAKDYITSILRAMDVDCTFSVYQNDTGAIVNIESDNNGTIIGRRGETLDSIQYLCSIIANKGDKDYFRITIDCLGYRGKRKETLIQLAAKVARSVTRTGRSQQLEPMNPYERRVIHSAISEIEGVSSRSVGEEPYRKIIISSTNPKAGSGRKRGDSKGGHRNDRRGGGRGRERREPIESRPIDLSTSFEKDYKKPKPEDSMEGGLYGKIEL
ncbi:MAG: KH domain-containing protein [Ruminococcus sp.]|nr:KH domain-containing protein [Ruminococcus sp.]